MKSIPLCVVTRSYVGNRALTARTERGYWAVVRQFERWLGRPATLRDLVESGDAYVAFRVVGGTVLGEPVAASRMTAAGHREVLAMLMRYAVTRKWCCRVTIRPIRKPRLVPKALLLAEILKLLSHATPRQKAAILLAYDTGFRRSDLFAARWSNLFQRKRAAYISLVVNKTSRIETRAIRAETLAALSAIRRPGDDRLLPGAKSVSAWTARWQRLGARAGVDVRRRGLQAVRRSGASYLAASGQSPKKYLGHASDGLAERHYIDPRIAADVPELPPWVG